MRLRFSGTRAKNMLLACGTVLLCLLVAEVLVRLLVAEPISGDYRQGHPLLGWTMVPNAAFQRRPVGAGDTTTVQTNSQGFRDTEHALEKPYGTKRIVVLGDSFSSGEQVAFPDVYHQRLQALLNAESDVQWEIINLAVSGYGTVQEWLLLDQAFAYDPDMIVLQMYPSNDICDNGAVLALYCSNNASDRPYARESGGSVRRIVAQPVRGLLRQSALFATTEQVFKMFLAWVKAGEKPDLGTYTRLELEARDRRIASLQLSYPIWAYVLSEHAEEWGPSADAWQITERLIEDMHTRIHSQKVLFLGVAIPTVHQVEGTQSDYAERRLQTLFSRLNTPFLAMLPIYRDQAARVLPYWEFHLNPDAHQIMAEEMFATMLREGWLD